ncbi:MAG: tyrosine-type recombinase/integrase [Planctomycetota bacterium]
MTQPKIPSMGRNNGLALYFHETFLPSELADRSFYTRRQYVNAVTQLCIFEQADPTLPTMTEEKVEEFHAWLLERGLYPETAHKYRMYIRRIVRHVYPDRCKKERPGRPRKPILGILQDEHLDVPGSLFRFLRETYVPGRMLGCSPGSIEQVVVAVRRFSVQLGRSPMIEDLTDENVSAHLAWLLDQGLSRSTVNSKRRALLAVWRHAHRKKLLTELPTVETLREYRRLPEAWNLEELARLLQACARTGGMIGELPACWYWTALVLVLYRTGLRRRAAMQIERGHVDLRTGWLFVPGENQKQKVDQRFRLPDDALDAIRKIWLPTRRLLFPWPSCSRQVFVQFGNVLRRGGLPCTRKDKFHKIRKTTASYIAKVAGVEAAGRQLGHSGVNVTKRYIDPTIAYSKFDTTGQLPDLPKPGDNGDHEEG